MGAEAVAAVAAPDALEPAQVVLVSGPARSGKSVWAERLVSATGLQVTYLATGPLRPEDISWQERLERHRQRRPPGWRQREIGAALPAALEEESQPDRVVLVDSLGTWLVHHLDLEAPAWERHCDQLVAALGRCRAAVVLVAEEVGWGVVPATAIGGLFRDRLGALMEQLEPHCDRSWLVIRGRALDLHRLGVPIQPSES